MEILSPLSVWKTILTISSVALPPGSLSARIQGLNCINLSVLCIIWNFMNCTI